MARETESVTRKRFGQEIEQIRQQLLEMGSTAGEMLAGAVEALLTQNAEIAETIIEQDNEIDALDLAIESEALLLLATQQPVVGSDLRFVSAALKTITDLERIGDHAVNIAKTALRMREDDIRYEAIVDFHHFVGIAQDMLSGAIRAMIGHDAALAYDTIDRDDEADVLYREAQRELRLAMQTPGGDEDRSRPVRASYLLFVAHYLERVCDHCTNIAERVIFAETGEVIVPDRVLTSGQRIS